MLEQMMPDDKITIPRKTRWSPPAFGRVDKSKADPEKEEEPGLLYQKVGVKEEKPNRIVFTFYDPIPRRFTCS